MPLRRGEGPVRSNIAGGKAQECFRPRPTDVLLAGTARAPVGVSRYVRKARVPYHVVAIGGC